MIILLLVIVWIVNDDKLKAVTADLTRTLSSHYAVFTVEHSNIDGVFSRIVYFSENH